jgi:hypothetical protein
MTDQSELGGGIGIGIGISISSGVSSRGSSPGSVSSSASSDRTAATSRPASHHSPTVNNLNSRGIVAVETEYVNGFSTTEGCRKTSKEAFFDRLCPGLREVQFNASYGALLGVFDQSYSSENKFNEELFEAVGKCIQDLATKKKGQFKFRPPVLGTDKNLIVLAPKDRLVIGDTEYAAGLVREKTVPKDRRTILVDDARLDHAAVMLRRPATANRNGNMASWNVWVALAVVDFKMQGKGVRGLATNSNGNVEPSALHPLDPESHGPLAQVMMYTAAHALRGAAALGQLPESIPFAVVSCRKTGGSNADEDECNWVHGNLVVPEACGFRYRFNVDAYGNLVEGTKLENHSSLAAYLHVMSHGLKLASEWLAEAFEAKPALQKTPAPHRLSGRSLHFGTDKPLTRDGETEARLVLVATPVSKYGKCGLHIAQGELFVATVNLQKLRSSVSGPHKVFWCRDTYDDKETSVLVKVSSRLCFNLLVPPGNAYLYGSADDVWKLRRTVREVLSRSLYGFYVTPGKHGLVQLLPNLVEQGYVVLRPKDWLFEDTWSALWDAFAQLVTGTLLPLARYEILHADLRAGYDVTSNVLYNPVAGSMRIIDLDSLCDFQSLDEMNFTRDGRNPESSAQHADDGSGVRSRAGDVRLGGLARRRSSRGRDTRRRSERRQHHRRGREIDRRRQGRRHGRRGSDRERTGSLPAEDGRKVREPSSRRSERRGSGPLKMDEPTVVLRWRSTCVTLCS